MDFSLNELWMTIVGVSVALAGLPQIIRLVQRKSSDDVSLALFLLIAHGQFWWVWYGWTKSSLSIVTANAVGIVMSAIIVWLILKYRSRVLIY